jgi:TatD DNase family protein
VKTFQRANVKAFQRANVLTDTHCHLNFDQFDHDRDELLRRAEQAGVTRILIPGLDLPTSRAAVALASSHPMLYSAVGIHPTEAATWNESTRNELMEILSPSPNGKGGRGEGKTVAIGEIGLDYYWNSAPHALQKTVLQEQLSLAAETGLPVILHMREARQAASEACAGDLLQILEKWAMELRSARSPLADRPGVLHSFSGSLEMARAAIALGFRIGVTGPVTFENARRRQEVVAALPLESLVIETDAPFQAPQPWRGKRNEPAYVRLIADKIALLHSCSFELVATVTSANAGKLFGWKEKP